MIAQPLNDDCGGAFNVVISDSEENVILTSGDTRGATASSIPKTVCSTVWYTDDIFFRFTTPSFVKEKGIVIRAYFNNSSVPTDVSAIGMALYESCDSSAVATHCFSSDDPDKDRFEVSGLCLLTDHTYYLRVWSTGGDATTEGTLRIGVYSNDEVEAYLWWETFGGGVEINGWTTYGTCANPGSNHNAFFKYLAEGYIDSGYFAAPGYRISSFSVCDGAVGVDSDYNDNNGTGESWGGTCSNPGTKYLISPALFSGDWNVPGLTLTWTQAIREYQSTFFIS